MENVTGPQPFTAVLVSGIPEESTDDVEKLCRLFGPLLSIKRNSKESATVTFRLALDAENFYQASRIGVPLGNSKLVVTPAPSQSEVPDQGDLKLVSYSAGFWLGPDEYVPCWIQGEGHLRAAIDSVAREIKVQHSLWTLWIAFSTVKKVRSCSGAQVNIYITTRSPPQLYQRFSPEHALVRATEFPSPAEDRLGACTVCCLTMHHSAADSMLQQLPCVQRANRATRGGRRPGVERKPSVPVVQRLPEKLDFAMNVDGVHDDLRYGLGCLLSANLLHAANVSSQFLDELRRGSSAECVGHAEAALYHLWNQRKPIYDPLKAFKQALSRGGHQGFLHRELPKDYFMTRSACVTPSRVLLFPPLPEQSNRVVKKYKTQSKHFIRVSFVDDNFGQLDIVATNIQQKVRSLLCEGIRTPVGLYYEFLAFSSSQLKARSCWFLRPTATTTAQHIISKLGDFTENRTVAKYAARIGLCFSSGRTGAKMKDDQVQRLDEIKSGNHIFSDGAGTLSLTMAQEISKRLGLNYTPSAYQIRLGGYKGVLCVDYSLGNSAQVVRLRPSMEKFQSDDKRLEILSTSKPMPGHLNHQAISIMSALGVPDEAFEKLHQRTLTRLEGITKRKGAKPYLNQHELLRYMLDSGLSGEPFLAYCLATIQQKELRDLKNKARIYVPNAKTALGVLDETGLLKRGEVYFRCSHGRVVEGDVVVVKFPALHPGDVRKFRAVNCPTLHDIEDCLVFPKDHKPGDRPHPNELSGSDLDGDLYFVCWEKSLIWRGKNRKPGDYDTPPKDEQRSQESLISREMIIDFFLEFMHNDYKLGQIADTHKAYADLVDVSAPYCLELAKLHSQAVDYAKSGVEVSSPRMTFKAFPDFMSRPNTSYNSPKILGKLYRKVQLREPKLNNGNAVQCDKDLLVEGYEDFETEAKKLKKEYDAELRGIMRQYSIETEAEVITGNVTKGHNRPDLRSNRLFDLPELLRKLVRQIQSAYRKRFEAEFIDQHDMPPEDLQRRRMQKAAAWYFVTYHQRDDDHPPPRGQGRKRGKKMKAHNRLLSFAWIMHDVMGEILHRGRD